MKVIETVRDLRQLIKEAKAEGKPLCRSHVLSAKAEAIERISEGTLAIMSSNLTMNDIVGLEVIKSFFKHVAKNSKMVIHPALFLSC